jgi:hypothetical protein
MEREGANLSTVRALLLKITAVPVAFQDDGSWIKAYLLNPGYGDVVSFVPELSLQKVKVHLTAAKQQLFDLSSVNQLRLIIVDDRSEASASGHLLIRRASQWVTKK